MRIPGYPTQNWQRNMMEEGKLKLNLKIEGLNPPFQADRFFSIHLLICFLKGFLEHHIPTNGNRPIWLTFVKFRFFSYCIKYLHHSQNRRMHCTSSLCPWSTKAKQSEFAPNTTDSKSILLLLHLKNRWKSQLSQATTTSAHHKFISIIPILSFRMQHYIVNTAKGKVLSLSLIKKAFTFINGNVKLEYFKDMKYSKVIF